MTVYVGRACNATWQWAHDNRLLDTVADGADFLLLVECRDDDDRPVPVAKYLGKDWHVQQALSDGEHAGSVTAVHRGSGLTEVSSHLSLLSRAGRDVQPRHLRTTVVRTKDGRRLRLGAGHLPLVSTGRQDDGLRALARWAAGGNAAMVRDRLKGEHPTPWLYAGDVNGPAEPVAHQMGAAGFYGASPMAIAWSKGLPGSPVTKRMRPGADHFVLTRRVQL